MTIRFRTAVREETHVLVGLAGPSSSGKTFSALRLARGMVDDMSQVYMIDTESGRGLHYVDQFPGYQYAALDPPFSPSAYLEALKAAEAAGARVIIVDSMSHEHEGPGGILEMHEQNLQRMAGNDYAKRERVKFTAWIEPKREHNRFVNTVLQVRAHLIFCFRAKDKLVMQKNAQGKNEPVSAGWQPICSDRFEYEMTAMLLLPPGAKGIPQIGAQAEKIPEQFTGLVRQGEQISEDLGRRFSEWARGGAETQKHSPVTQGHTPLERAKDVARNGSAAFIQYWQGLSKPERAAINDHRPELKRIASEADALSDDPSLDSDDPFGLPTDPPEDHNAGTVNPTAGSSSDTFDEEEWERSILLLIDEHKDDPDGLKEIMGRDEQKRAYAIVHEEGAISKLMNVEAAYEAVTGEKLPFQIPAEAAE